MAENSEEEQPQTQLPVNRIHALYHTSIHIVITLYLDEYCSNMLQNQKRALRQPGLQQFQTLPVNHIHTLYYTSVRILITLYMDEYW